MTRPISAVAVSAIEAAMARLLSDPQAHGGLTVARLASEAGLSRATLYRAPDLLRQYRGAAAALPPQESTPTSSDRVHLLEAEIAALRGRETDELRELRAANRRMAQHIQALSLLVREQERRVAQLQAESPLPASSRVVPFVTPGEAPTR